ncbi:radical S-adenosyl methionine domain-containing protein 2-like [Adelges cooleyi]|uniref:radical S-adenosyl methionine domain-containing protein 2-like n=1 Tax=Adelges cooleyi TaxID=133065 RepID=UPI0021808414|nr:radical S-adenosyl methionine domain-containing protein 2-like [Adelges cooleyi]
MSIFSEPVEKLRALLRTMANAIIRYLTAVFLPHAGDRIVPKRVNYHFTRACNYRCGFCFHTGTTSFVLPVEDAMRGLGLLKDAGMEKINFSGGEPFIHQRGRFVGELVAYCKRTLGLDSVSIVSNGDVECLVPETNALMKDSYLILDEYMRFLNCRGDAKEPSKSILDVGVNNALMFSGFDEKAFIERGGLYVWSKPKQYNNLDW